MLEQLMTQESPVLNDGDYDDHLDHIYCCDPDLALCGADIEGVTEETWDTEPANPCIVCEDLVGKPCRICGAE